MPIKDPELLTEADFPVEFGRYVLTGLLGEGGMGQVWLAYDKQLERQVAVKMVSRKYVANQQALNALKAEVQKSLELTHPNIIRIHDLMDQPGEAPFIAIEYVEGEDLQEKLKQQEGGSLHVEGA